jgi:hypothetical protein
LNWRTSLSKSLTTEVYKAAELAMAIKDGFQKMEEVYKNVPKENWPK